MTDIELKNSVLGNILIIIFLNFTSKESLKMVMRSLCRFAVGCY